MPTPLKTFLPGDMRVAGQAIVAHAAVADAVVAHAAVAKPVA